MLRLSHLYESGFGPRRIVFTGGRQIGCITFRSGGDWLVERWHMGACEVVGTAPTEDEAVSLLRK